MFIKSGYELNVTITIEREEYILQISDRCESDIDKIFQTFDTTKFIIDHYHIHWII